MWFIGVELEQETSAPPPKKILDPPLCYTCNFELQRGNVYDHNRAPTWDVKSVDSVHL